MKVSVIVSIFNGVDILPITLPALFNQNYPADMTEIICIDDASTDDTNEYLHQLDIKDRIITIRHPNNRGRCATRNSGIKTATGDLLIFIDCEIEVQNDFLSNHVSWHKKEKVVGILSNLRPKQPNNLDKYQRYIFYGKRGAKLINPETPLPFKYFVMTCSSVKAKAIKKTGLFDETLPGYGIDLEYAYRLWQNYPEGLFFAREIEVYMHKVKTLERAMQDFREYGEKNVPIIVQKFPELAPFVGADFVSTKWTRNLLKRLTGALFINPLMMKIARFKLKIIPYPLSNFFVRYLLLASVASGYRTSLKR